MKSAFIRRRPQFNVISYGNGTAYALEQKPSYRSVFFQGDDADQFKREMDAFEDRLDTDAALAELWHQYSELAS